MLNKIRTRILAMSFAALALLAMSSTANAEHYNRVVKVVNDSSVSMYHLYVSNVGTEVWGPDQLGEYQVIGPDRYWIINMDDGSGYCLFDLKAVMSDGSVAERHNFNVCSESSWTVTD